VTNELPISESRVLSTLHEDGTRRWMYPRVSHGRFLRARRTLAYALIAVFTLLPYIPINGKPAILLNIPAREFTFFGFTFLPTDTLLLALFMVMLIISIFLVTALFGRVWCGWMCPQTVYTEFVYRPLERLFDGPPGPRHTPGKKTSGLRTVLKYALYTVISIYLAHAFLAYFVGVEDLAQWVRRSPIEHPTSFLVMLLTTGLMMFDFSFFREQTCIVACPYGRFQSVMLDRDSLIVSYDVRRGEPRGKGRRPSGAESQLGDCIDCGSCVDTCPTGIDIRDGLQLECIACTQCIDACDGVMDRLSRPRGLIRFSSQTRMAGTPSRLLRPRVIVYPSIIALLLIAFGSVLASKQSADVTLLRGLGLPYTELKPGEITNQIRVKIKNRSGRDAAYKIELSQGVPAQLNAAENPIAVAAGQSRTEAVFIMLPRGEFKTGRRDITLRISDGAEFHKEVDYRLLGPQDFAARTTPDGNGREGNDG
jgi:cytochrome c oxidase accessory protein FixG